MQRMWMLFCAVGLLAGVALAADEKDAAKAVDPKAADPAAKDGPTKEVPKGPGITDPIGPLKNLKDKVSYAIGLNIGRNMIRDAVDIDADLLATGIKAAMAEKGGKGEKPLLTEEQIKDVIVAFQAEMERMAAEKRDNVRKAGIAFLAENKKKEGIITTKSGLQYEVVTEGTGPKPKSTDTVRTHYKGTLLDGTQFDSSYEREVRGEDGVVTKKPVPATFQVDGVIEGWTEALQLMKVGSKWRLFVPSELAYKERGTRDGTIGPNSVLVFEVELLGIEPADPLKK